MATENSINTILFFNTLINLVSIKLNANNFLLWKNYLETVLKSQKLLGYIDGSIPKPPEAKKDGKVVKTSEFESWETMDNLVLSLIYTSLFEEIMSRIIGAKSSHQVSTSFHNIYTSHSKARELQLRQELTNCSKCTSTIIEFLKKYKDICDALEAITIDQPVKEKEKVIYLFKGLGSEYKMFSTSIMARPPVPSFEDIVSLLFSQDMLFYSFASSHHLVQNISFTIQHGGAHGTIQDEEAMEAEMEG